MTEILFSIIVILICVIVYTRRNISELKLMPNKRATIKELNVENDRLKKLIKNLKEKLIDNHYEIEHWHKRDKALSLSCEKNRSYDRLGIAIRDIVDMEKKNHD